MKDEMPREIWAYTRDKLGEDFAGEWITNPRMATRVNTARYIRADADAEVRKALADRILNYLGNGGLFNPELMDHDKVLRLLLDCGAYLGGESR